MILEKLFSSSAHNVSWKGLLQALLFLRLLKENSQSKLKKYNYIRPEYAHIHHFYHCIAFV